MNENTIIFTNITNIVLILLFWFYRNKVKKIETEHRTVLSGLCVQTCNIICICARQDYILNKIPLNVLMDVILSQPLPDQMKVNHFGMSGITLQDLEERGVGHVFRNYFKVGEENNSETKNS